MEQGSRIREPIVILAMPRSGSSMTAGIFAKHGVWVGPCRDGDHRNPTGYYESLPLKRALIKHRGKLTHKGELAYPMKGWREIAERILADNGYDGGPWLVKHSAMYYPLWSEFEPTYICVRRNPDSVRKSGQASGFFKNGDAIKPHIEVMDHVRDHLGAVDVFTDELVGGDYSSLENAFTASGLTFQPEIADDFIDPRHWHY